MRIISAFLCVLFIAVLTGCGNGPQSGVIEPGYNRASELARLAGEEAGELVDVKDRLTRQLNIANLQIQHGSNEDARKTLAEAAETLRKAEDLETRTRISGWVSISELCRAADDKGGAMTACNTARKELEAVQPVALRAEFVRGVAIEVRETRGNAEAIALLKTGSAWAREINDAQHRRDAYTAIGVDLFNMDAYDAGRDVLRQDADPTWRTDTLVALFQDASAVQSGPRMVTANAMSAAAPAPPGSIDAAQGSGKLQKAFGYDLGYQTFKEGK